MVIWSATHGQSWRSGPACEVALEGTRLRACRGKVQWDIDLGSVGTRVEFHHWGLGRGTVMLVETGGPPLAIAGEGFTTGDLDYHAPLARGPDLILPKPHFEAMLALLPKVFLDRDKTVRTFWLWRNTFRATTALRPLLYVFAFILTCGLSVRAAPAPLAAGLSLGLALALITLAVRQVQRLGRPEMKLALDGTQLLLARADSKSPLGQWPRATLKIRSARWTVPPAGRGGYVALVDMPMVIVEGILPRPLSIGGSALWVGTGGPKATPPQFLISPACWPAFAEALVPRQMPSPAPAQASPDSSDQLSRRN